MYPVSASGHAALHAGQWKHCGLCLVVSPLGCEFGMTCWVMVGGGGGMLCFVFMLRRLCS